MLSGLENKYTKISTDTTIIDQLISKRKEPIKLLQIRNKAKIKTKKKNLKKLQHFGENEKKSFSTRYDHQ